LTAVSTASAPEFIIRTLSNPVMPASSSHSGPNWSLWNAREVSVIRSACVLRASTIRG
jgi:hypothetical protein